MVQTGVTPYQAARRAGINVGTIYRSRLYKLWLAGDTDALAKEMEVGRPVPTYKRKDKAMVIARNIPDGKD